MEDDDVIEYYEYRAAWLQYVDGMDQAEAQQEARRRLQKRGVAQDRIKQLTEEK